MPTPAAEIDIDEALVRSLLADQYPPLAQCDIHIANNGWDNVIARAGDRAIRLPRRALGAKLLEHEVRWLPELAGKLPLAVPVPEFVGEPAENYPWRWSVSRWLPGAALSAAPPVDQTAAARALAEFVVCLHRPAPENAPVNLFRGVPLEHRAESVLKHAELLRDRIDFARVMSVWKQLLVTPPWDGAALWLHGDLHPANMLTHQGRLSAIIDFGDITSGDPASDLAAAWMMFASEARDVFRHTAGIMDATWHRAAAWALNFSLVFMTADEHTPMPAIGRATLESVLDAFS
jgi:aminoglycoside phosphotransferase (APT) family kinase protein